MGKYDSGNSWNLDKESWFSKILKAAASVLVVAFIFGFMFLCFTALS